MDHLANSHGASDPVIDAGGARILVIDLDTWLIPGPAPPGAVKVTDPNGLPEPESSLAAIGGTCLALPVLRSQGREGFAIAVGAGVIRGQATATRASLLARSPLSGRLAQGQVGSDLARRLGSIGSGLVLLGRARWPDAVLRVTQKGEWLLESNPGLSGMGSRERAEHLIAEHGEAAILRCGPAAHVGVRFANLSAGVDPPSFVGRGGLGLVFAELGLAALVVQLDPLGEASGQETWVEALLQSPRLIARAQGQRLEEARGKGGEGSTQRHGCKGCPTPCGFVFQTPDKRSGNARFSALEPWMRSIPGAPQEVIETFLAASNRLGVDAVEGASCLSLVLQSQSGLDRSDWLPLFEALCRGRVGPAAFRLGGVELSRALGEKGQAHFAQGESVRPAHHPMETLYQAIGVRGPEPVRHHVFLVGDHVEPARMQRLVAPLALPKGSEDPHSVLGKGRLLWWHENLVAGVDALGICAFSVGGLLADGVVDLDTLASQILPSGFTLAGASGPAETLLCLGAGALAQMAEHGERPKGIGEHEDPRFGTLEFEIDEYLRLRYGYAEAGGLAGSIPEWASAEDGANFSELDPVPSGSAAPKGETHVTLRFKGALGRRMSPVARLRFGAPPTWTEVLQEVAKGLPQAASWLLRSGEPIPAGLCEGRWLQAHDRVFDGATVEVVLAISGG